MNLEQVLVLVWATFTTLRHLVVVHLVEILIGTALLAGAGACWWYVRRQLVIRSAPAPEPEA